MNREEKCKYVAATFAIACDLSDKSTGIEQFDNAVTYDGEIIYSTEVVGELSDAQLDKIISDNPELVTVTDNVEKLFILGMYNSLFYVKRLGLEDSARYTMHTNVDMPYLSGVRICMLRCNGNQVFIYKVDNDYFVRKSSIETLSSMISYFMEGDKRQLGVLNYELWGNHRSKQTLFNLAVLILLAKEEDTFSGANFGLPEFIITISEDNKLIRATAVEDRSLSCEVGPHTEGYFADVIPYAIVYFYCQKEGNDYKFAKSLFSRVAEVWNNRESIKQDTINGNPRKFFMTKTDTGKDCLLTLMRADFCKAILIIVKIDDEIHLAVTSSGDNYNFCIKKQSEVYLFDSALTNLGAPADKATLEDIFPVSK